MPNALSTQNKTLNVDSSLNLRFQDTANQSVLVNYCVASNLSFYLIVTDLSNAQSNTYILDPNASELTIDLSAYQAVTYSITLVSDGNIIESKNLIKN
jgi:hypothetical protein